MQILFAGHDYVIVKEDADYHANLPKSSKSKSKSSVSKQGVLDNVEENKA
jgi:hypothetical protein